MRPIAHAAFILAPSLAVLAALPAEAPRVAVVNSRFEVTLADGTSLPQKELAGVVLTLGDGAGETRRLRIDSAEPDPADPAGEHVLYSMSEQTGPNGQWENVCRPDRKGRRAGFPLRGAFTADGRHVDARGRISIACAGGAEAQYGVLRLQAPGPRG